MHKWIVASTIWLLVVFTDTVVAENNSRESPRKAYRMLYTGIEGAMPTNAHMKWLNYHATKQRLLGEMDEHDANPVYAVDGAIRKFGSNAVSVGGCSIAIANDFITPGSGSGQTRENIVIIDGDVINAGRCK